MSLLTDIWDITPTGMVINKLGETLGPAVLSASDQAADIDAIDMYIATSTPINSKAQQLKNEWMSWVSGLSWYDKNVNEAVAAEAFNRRNAFMRANAPADQLESVNTFLKNVPAVDPVTGKINRVTETGDRIVPPTPLVPTTYKVVAVATAAGVSVLVVLKKLHIL